MRHLDPDTFIDLLDGAGDPAAVDHLARCAACRRELAALRATWQAATDAPMPEPSPLFWDHLSARVHDAVAAGPRPTKGPAWLPVSVSWRTLAAAGVVAAALVAAVMLQTSSSGDRPAVPASAAQVDRSAAPAAQAGAPLPLDPLADDVSIGFVIDLASNVDWDADEGLGWSGRADIDRAVADLTDAERAELQRLLREALAGA